MCHLCLHSPTRTQVSRVVVTFLTVMLTFWPIASACAEQGQHMVMEAEMILAIEDRLAGDEFVQENLIDVVSEKGIVTLLGEVDNILARNGQRHSQHPSREFAVSLINYLSIL